MSGIELDNFNPQPAVAPSHAGALRSGRHGNSSTSPTRGLAFKDIRLNPAALLVKPKLYHLGLVGIEPAQVVPGRGGDEILTVARAAKNFVCQDRVFLRARVFADNLFLTVPVNLNANAHNIVP